MKTIQLEWKEFNVNLETVQAAIKLIDPACCGMSGNSKLEIHSTNDELSQEAIDDIQAYWDALDEESEEATSYKTATQIKEEKEADVAAKKATARAKFITMGLTEAEADAILGV